MTEYTHLCESILVLISKAIQKRALRNIAGLKIGWILWEILMNIPVSLFRFLFSSLVSF